MTPTPRARLLSRILLAFGWLAVAFAATVAFAADPPPLCTTTVEKDWCKDKPKEIPLCKGWNSTSLEKCQGIPADPNAQPPVPAVVAEASEIVPAEFYYCKNVPAAWLPEWYWACIPWKSDGEPVMELCYRRYKCEWSGAVDQLCTRGAEILPANYQPGYTMTDQCLRPESVPAP